MKNELTSKSSNSFSETFAKLLQEYLPKAIYNICKVDIDSLVKSGACSAEWIEYFTKQNEKIKKRLVIPDEKIAEFNKLVKQYLSKEQIKADLQSGIPLKALSWKEPYASMMLHGKIETRTWPTKYRGLVLICASKNRYTPEQLEHISSYHQISKMAWIIQKTGSFAFIFDSSFTLGHAIAIGRLVDCRRMRVNDGKAFVAYAGNLWCHIYEDVTAIEPIPFKGAQKWSNVSKEIIDQIKFM